MKKTSAVIKTLEIWCMEEQKVTGRVIWDAKKQNSLAEEEEEEVVQNSHSPRTDTHW